MVNIKYSFGDEILFERNETTVPDISDIIYHHGDEYSILEITNFEDTNGDPWRSFIELKKHAD